MTQMKVNDVAKNAGLSPHTVRYYEGVGLLKAVRDPNNGYRRFEIDVIKRLRFVRDAKRLGLVLVEIREILAICDAGESPCPLVREIVRRRIAENASRIRELMRLQRRLQAAQQQWARMPDAAPDADALCHLIESLDSADA